MFNVAIATLNIMTDFDNEYVILNLGLNNF